MPFDGRVWKEACSLRDNGYDVSVLCPRGKGYESGHEVLQDVHIFRHPMVKEGDSTFGYIWEFSFALLCEVLYTLYIYFTRGFHVIQGCNPPDDIFLVALPYKLLGVKYIFDHHDANPELYVSKYGKTGLLYKAQMWLERLTYLFSDAVMATNGSYKELAVRRGGLNPGQVFVVRNGPDIETFRPVPPDPSLKHGKEFLVGYVGTMSVQEGLDILLEVARIINNSGRRDVHFTCVGGGPGLKSLRQMASDMNLDDTVTFTGRISDKDLIAILSTADVCVNPDRPCEMNDISTMIKIMEYMALGKPIVQFDLKEGRVSAGESSLYVDSKAGACGFADMILWLLAHPEESARMGQCGRSRVEQTLSWKYSESNLLAAYEQVFSKRSSVHRSCVETCERDTGLSTVSSLSAEKSVIPDKSK